MAKHTDSEVKGAFVRFHAIPRKDVQVNFEHGQWWVTSLPTGAQWSVVETSNGIEFEQVTEGKAA
jgi:hypothetical protein